MTVGREEDPFLSAGYGTTSFFSIHRSLWKLLLFVTIMILPIFYIYSTGQFFWQESLLKMTFLGNMGGTHMFCKHRRLEFTDVNLQCDRGFVLDTEHAVFGVISNEFLFMGFCHQSRIDKRIHEMGFHNCSNDMNPEVVKRMTNDLNHKCHLEEQCRLNFKDIINTQQSKTCDHKAVLYVQAPCIIP